MLGKLLGIKKRADAVLLVARLNDRAQPMDRGELYEDPLEAVLKKRRAGSVTGGGTQLGKDAEIEFCDIEIEVHEPVADALTLVKTTLEELGAPKGSKLILEAEGEELPFGLNEGLAVYLNGTDLPDEVYAECDSNFVYSEFNRLLGTDGKVHSHWQGPTETALYMYGRSFETMKKRLSSFLASYPLCQKSRIEQIA
jgi:hypothetical protein